MYGDDNEFFLGKNLVGRKIYIIFVENKENLKIMSRTIEEIQKYFDERPELWRKICRKAKA